MVYLAGEGLPPDAAQARKLAERAVALDDPSGLECEAGHTLTLAGYLAEENLYILCNPAIATPGLQLITAAALKHYWRSDHYGGLSNNILSRPAIVIEKP